MATLVLALVILGAGPSTSPSLPEVVVSEGLNGDFVSTSCGRSGSEQSREPKVFRVAREYEAWPRAVRIDVGNSLGASALAELIVTHRATDFAEMLKRLGVQAVALGRRDLATARSTLTMAATAARGLGVPFIASNITCGLSAKALCDELVPMTLIDTPKGSIAVVSVLAPAVLDSVASDRRADVELTDPKQAIEAATRTAHARGARWVIAVYHGARGHELDDTLALGEQLTTSSAADTPDALVALQVSDKISSVTTPSGLSVVASVSGRATRVWPARESARSSDSATDAGSAPSLRAWADEVDAWLCGSYGSADAGWALSAPVEAQALVGNLLDVVRARASAEIAVFNRSAISAPDLLETHLTPLDVATTVPFDNSLRKARVSGALVKKMIAHDASAHDLYLRGVTVSPSGEARINGRLIDDLQPYVVVTSDYLAAGGDGVITDNSLRFEPLEGIGTTRSVWVEALNERAAQGLEADAPMADPAKRARWLFRTTADVSFSFVRVVNPATAVYTDTQLSRANAAAFRGDVEFRADADHSEYTWENGLRLRYGFSRTQSADPAATSAIAETDDLMYLRNTATLRRYDSSAPPKPYVPVPFVESYVESEFTKPDARAYHHLEWRPIAGFRLPLLPELSLFAGAGVDWETLALASQRPLNEPPAAAVLVGGAALRPKALFALGAAPVTGEGTLDVSWRDPGNTSSALVRLHVKVSVPILSLLSLTFAYDLFARNLADGLLTANGGDAGWGFAHDVVVGLSFRWAEPLQGFAF